MHVFCELFTNPLWIHSVMCISKIDMRDLYSFRLCSRAFPSLTNCDLEPWLDEHQHIFCTRSRFLFDFSLPQARTVFGETKVEVCRFAIDAFILLRTAGLDHSCCNKTLNIDLSCPQHFYFATTCFFRLFVALNCSTIFTNTFHFECNRKAASTNCCNKRCNDPFRLLFNDFN
jgi:hypothetical protein